MNHLFRRISAMSALAAALLLRPAVSQMPTELLDAHETLQLVRGGLGMTEGPAADSSGTLFFTEPFNNTLWRVDLDGTVTLLKNNTLGANGLAFDPQDRLILCEIDRVSRFEADSSITTLASFTGRANDLSLCPDGGVFFTEPDWNVPANGDVWYIPAEGAARKVLVAEVGFPNGIAYLAESRMLYLAISRENVIRRYPVDADMNLGAPDTFVTVSGPDGFAIDEHGNFWVASYNTARIFVFDSSGASVGQIHVTQQSSITNCAFAGPDRDILYVTGQNAVYRIQTRVRGRGTTGAVSAAGPRMGLLPAHHGRQSQWRTRAGQAALRSPASNAATTALLLDGRVLKQAPAIDISAITLMRF